jgi:hypothetical protein
MTTFNQFTDRNRDQQDAYERGLWGQLEYTDKSGAVLKVRGTGVEGGTLDENVPLLNTGYGFNVSQNYNTEVLLLSMNSDTNQKYAVASIPRDKQRKWPEGTGGVQHPTNADKFVQLDDDSIWLKDGVFHLGNDKGLTIEVDGGNVVLRCSNLDIQSEKLTHNGVNIGDDHVHGGVVRGGVDTLGPH